MSEPSYEELRQAQQEEYGTYVAVLPISIGGAAAFNPGDPVPVGHVTRGVVPPDAVRATAEPAEVTTAAGPAEPSTEAAPADLQSGS